jgi:hypothetical protein
VDEGDAAGVRSRPAFRDEEIARGGEGDLHGSFQPAGEIRDVLCGKRAWGQQQNEKKENGGKENQSLVDHIHLLD